MIAAGNLRPVEFPQRDSRIVIIHLHCIGGIANDYHQIAPLSIGLSVKTA